MKKILLFIALFFPFILFAANNIEKIDGRSKYLMDMDADIDPESYLVNHQDDELFEIVNFKNGTSNKDDNIKNYRGRIVILHFWATWCGHCINEMKDLDELAAILRKKEIKDIEIIPISVDGENISVVKNFYAANAIENLGVFHDRQNVYMASLGRSSIPLTFIIGRDGKQITVANGPVPWNNNSIVDYLKSLL
jgi:thiol-disulfide isomerase/thioredoxin